MRKRNSRSGSCKSNSEYGQLITPTSNSAISRMEERQHTSSMWLKTCSMAAGITPGSSSVPDMVWVFPLPVCPYLSARTRRHAWSQRQSSSNLQLRLQVVTHAKTVPLNPSIAARTTGAICAWYIELVGSGWSSRESVKGYWAPQ